ncbi:hypothetical protein INN71_12010 [Nocardioides sp. ChNu-153]|uniref:hypothetical protein n=1 Tax=Nocardioides sp. ChNu-153 TaxID=2779364 RepID=UPI0026564306|nr:hypothetical protein [Nocardioides sp. ChNu-153]MDN7122114.1 hypothetical protein [Nocardioides sp. ChNu-153]
MHPTRIQVRATTGPATTPSLEDELVAAGPAVAADPGRAPAAVRRWLRTLWAVGAWLRGRHDAVADATSPAPPAPESPTWTRPAALPAPYRVSLEHWADALAAGGTALQGPLGLDRLHAQPSGVVLVRVTAHPLGDPAADVGGVVGDLARLQWYVEAAGHPAGTLQRLAAAFTTGYRGLPPDARLDESALRRAVALRVGHRAGEPAPPPGGDDDAAPVRALVERAWLLED